MAIIFDFDKTLTNRDSITLFTFFLWRGRYLSGQKSLQVIWLSARYYFGWLDNDEFKNSYFRLLQVKKTDIYKWFDDYLRSDLFRNNLNMSGTLLSLSNDDGIVIVTASPQYYVSRAFPGINVIGGVLSFDKSGFCNGYKNCYAGTKVQKLVKSDVKVDYVFTDSMSDWPLFEFCRKQSFIVKKGKVKRVL